MPIPSRTLLFEQRPFSGTIREKAILVAFREDCFHAFSWATRVVRTGLLSLMANRSQKHTVKKDVDSIRKRISKITPDYEIVMYRLIRKGSGGKLEGWVSSFLALCFIYPGLSPLQYRNK